MGLRGLERINGIEPIRIISKNIQHSNTPFGSIKHMIPDAVDTYQAYNDILIRFVELIGGHDVHVLVSISLLFIN